MTRISALQVFGNSLGESFRSGVHPIRSVIVEAIFGRALTAVADKLVWEVEELLIVVNAAGVVKHCALEMRRTKGGGEELATSSFYSSFLKNFLVF